MLALSALSAVSALVAVAGCSGTSPAAHTPERVAVATSSIALPPTTGGFDYQLGGGYRPAARVSIVTRDSTDVPAKGIYSICYVNGFQTQPGAVWPGALILHSSSGAPLVDPGWPDEHIIDIGTPGKRAAAATRIGTMVTECAKKGFKAVEFDNLDSYSRSKGAFTLSDAIAFATLLVKHAHASGLAASQKNTAELGTRGKTMIGFDFATTEECDRYDECSAFTRVYGARVYDIEYTDDLRGSFSAVCSRASTPKLTVLRDRSLATPTTASAGEPFVDRRC